MGPCDPGKAGYKCPSIFALTAEALEGDKQRFLGLGFDGYLSKPLQMHTLQEALKTTAEPGTMPGRQSGTLRLHYRIAGSTASRTEILLGISLSS
jgi:DNA-binding response OmpR family regulator